MNYNLAGNEVNFDVKNLLTNFMKKSISYSMGNIMESFIKKCKFSTAILVHNTISILFIYYFNQVLLELFILVYVSYTVHYANSLNYW